MAVVPDASTPAAKTGTGYVTPTNTFTSASFTPPVGAVLVVILNTNSSTGANTLSAFSCTDNLGTHLTYTQVGQIGNLVSDAQVTVWKSSAVVTSTPMTVSTSFNGTGNDAASPYMQRVVVFAGADITSPIGASGGARVTTAPNFSYIATRSGSLGYFGYSDWTQSAIPTIPAGETMDASSTVSGQDTFAVIRNSSPTPSTGDKVTMYTTAPTASLQVSYLYFEVIPALVGPTGGSVPSGTGITAGSLSAPFLFFDTGDYGIGV